MLYVGKCKDCGFIVKGSDVTEFKDLMAKHRNESHSEAWVFVKRLPLQDFDSFSKVRIADKETEAFMKNAMNNVGFWKAIRKFPTLQNVPFSGLGDREHKPFCDPLRQNSARG